MPGGRSLQDRQPTYTLQLQHTNTPTTNQNLISLFSFNREISIHTGCKHLKSAGKGTEKQVRVMNLDGRVVLSLVTIITSSSQ